MAEAVRKNWQELCNAAFEAKNPDQLLVILQQLDTVLKHEEEVRRDFRMGRSSGKMGGETQCP
jgi:hypothetical protein